MHKYHNEMSHVGTEKTVRNILNSYWFPEMKTKVERHVKCDYCSSFVTSKDVAKSTVKLAVKLFTNSMASTMSFKSQNKKIPFHKLKMWEVIQGALLIKFDDTALSQAEETMKSWLANAPWRKQDNETYGKRTMKTK
ncbi:uncharacterized protein LOC112588718 [Harpegnathos saltator]|uniref:uncharacterized protein LOC112588718 n=1 Tax=Harpegnathos saltator TaxID=610380 RepID=UPI000DBEDBAF|nr:uncharacterized protein LOC112588718 [Harpegnathos saltator]